MISALKKYYENCGISALRFNCKHFKECRAECDEKSKFTTAREPYIGKYYGKKGIPKLLFLSLDSGDEEGNPELKTIQAMREGALKLKPEQIPKGRHWYITHQFAWILFDEFNKNSDSNLDIGHTDEKMHFYPKNEIYKIMPYFAHTNSAKCCMNKQHSKQANKILFANCRGYIPKEIKIFDPHILVTQGDYAKKVIEEAIRNGIFSLKNPRNFRKANKKKPDVMIIEIRNNKPVEWIHHYHPRSFGHFYPKNYHKFRAYGKKAVQFLAKNYPELKSPK
jgi:hypothetical protein